MTMRCLNTLPFLGACIAWPLLLLGCGAPASPAATAPARSALTEFGQATRTRAIPPSTPTVTLLTRGHGWRRVHIAGYAQDIDAPNKISYIDKDLLVIDTPEGLADAPIPNAARADLGRTKKGEVTLIDLEQVSVLERQMALGTPAGLLGCDDADKTVEKQLTEKRQAHFNRTGETGSFTGSIAIQAEFAADVIAKASFRVKKKLCVPYSATFIKAEFIGTGQSTLHATIDAAFPIEWHAQEQLAEFTLARMLFAAGPVPLYVALTLPIEAGVDVSGRAQLRLAGALTAAATFNMACDKQGCEGEKRASYQFTPEQTPTMAVRAQADVIPWVQASIKATVLDDSIAYGQVGVRAALDADLFGYDGSTCGNADERSKSEHVQAALLNTRAAIGVVARAEFLDSIEFQKVYPLLDSHLGFYDLGSSSAFSPLVELSALSPAPAVQAKISMRPCWPYSSPMKYRIDWSDGTTDEVTGAPAGLSKAHTYASGGDKRVTVTPITDTDGRGPGRETARSVELDDRSFNSAFSSVALTME